MGSRLTTKLASRRVSVALTKASSIQQAISEVPPFDTKGKVTPVNGRMSSEPKMLRPICTIIRLTAAQPAMT